MNFVKYNFISVGIDIGADFSELSIALPSSELLGRTYKVIHHKIQSLEGAVLRIKNAENEYSLKAKIFMESTGIYHYPLYYFLENAGFEVFVLNPLITNSNKDINIRKVHNDKLDSQKIAVLGLNSALKVSVIPNDSVLNIRNITREYFNVQRERTQYVNKLNGQLRQAFPQYLKVFSKITGVTSMKILQDFTTPENISATSKRKLINVISKASRKGIAASELTYAKLKQAADEAQIFGHAVESNYYLIRHFVEMIQSFDRIAFTLLERIKSMLSQPDCEKTAQQVELLQSIPGVGFLGAITLICEIGDFEVFSRPKQLYAYFGLDPAVKQSGNFVGTNVKISKRGSSYARRIIYIIALQSVGTARNGEPKNPVLQNYYREKCKSKTKMTALGAIMHKVCNIVFAVLRNKQKFVLTTPEQHRFAYSADIKKVS